MGMTHDMQCVLEDLINTLNAFNGTDALDGYLDGLAEEYNQRLEYLNMPTIKVIYPENIEEE